MKGRRQRDDFAWIVDLVSSRRRAPARSRPGREGYENVEQILDRRAQAKRRRKAILQLLLQMLPILFMILLTLLFA